MNLLVKGRLEPQRAVRQMFQRFQHLCAALQQKLLVSAIEIRDDFFFARSFTVTCASKDAHADRQLKLAGAHRLFEKLSQRVCGGIAIELSIFYNFRRHGELPLKRSMRLLNEAHNKTQQRFGTNTNRYFFFFPDTCTTAVTGCCLFSHHCCPIPTMLLVKIYNANPLEIGEIMKMPAIAIGITFIIICCCGSVEVIGVIFDTRYIDKPIMIGNT